MLVGEIVACEFTQAEQAAVLGNSVKPHAAAELFEKFVVGVGHRVGQVHVFAATDFEHGVAGDDAFFKRSKSDRWLDGGARNRAVGVSKLLIDDGKNAAGVGIDRDYGTVVAAKSFDSSCANDGIIVAGDVA